MTSPFRTVASLIRPPVLATFHVRAMSTEAIKNRPPEWSKTKVSQIFEETMQLTDERIATLEEGKLRLFYKALRTNRIEIEIQLNTLSRGHSEQTDELSTLVEKLKMQSKNVGMMLEKIIPRLDSNFLFMQQFV